MNIGEKLLELRKTKQLSQEAVAEKLNVTRQTISKWETNQSTPDFDKIIPLCELYGITADELLKGKENEKQPAEEKQKEKAEENNNEDLVRVKRAGGIAKGILLYFIAIVWIMISIPVLMIDPIISSAIFFMICGIGTYLIVHTCIMYKKGKNIKEDKTEKIVKHINNIIASIVAIIYFVISFITMAWHITWIIWVIYGIVEEIVKLIFMLRSDENEK